MIVNVHVFSQTAREEILQCRRKREGAPYASGTAAEKDKRLKRRDQESRAVESEEQKGARIQRKHSRQKTSQTRRCKSK